MQLYFDVLLSVLLKCDCILFDSLLFPYLFFCATYCSEFHSICFTTSPPCKSVDIRVINLLLYDIFVLQDALSYVSMLMCLYRPV